MRLARASSPGDTPARHSDSPQVAIAPLPTGTRLTGLRKPNAPAALNSDRELSETTLLFVCYPSRVQQLSREPLSQLSLNVIGATNNLFCLREVDRSRSDPSDRRCVARWLFPSNVFEERMPVGVIRRHWPAGEAIHACSLA
jgi:hypothetical protein